MKALLFGSIGSIVETSEIQRQAFNQSFKDNGLDWYWSRSDYQPMLAVSGGRQRIANEATRRGVEVDAGKLHRCKTQIFQTMMRDGSAAPRSGVLGSILLAKEVGALVGLVTSTSPENVDAIFSAISGTINRSDFDVVVDIDQCDHAKPDPQCYRIATESLKITARHCLAVEDNVDGVTAAHHAGITCIANPGANTADHDYSNASEVTDDLVASVRNYLAGRAAVV